MAKSDVGIDRYLNDNTTNGVLMRQCLSLARDSGLELVEEDVGNIVKILNLTEIGLLEKMGKGEVSLMLRSYYAGRYGPRNNSN